MYRSPQQPALSASNRSRFGSFYSAQIPWYILHLGCGVVARIFQPNEYARVPKVSD